jgi:hypothetical protein
MGGGKGVFTAMGLEGIVSRIRQHPPHQLPDPFFILDYENGLIPSREDADSG